VPLLIVSILTASMVNLGLSEAERQRMNGLRVVWHNYVAAALLSAVLFYCKEALTMAWGEQPAKSVLLGIATGAVYLITFLINQQSIISCGPSLTILASKLGVMILVLAAALLWQEPLTLSGIIGVLLACTALFLFHGDHLSFHGLLPVVFLFGGLSEIVKKIYTLYGDTRYQYLFYCVVFVVCLLISSILLYIRKIPLHVRLRECLLGWTIGAANLGATYFVICALTQLPASVVFPSMSGGVILVTVLVGTLRFHDTLTKPRIAGLILTLVSLVLMNL
jgi:multidrug transporter EmrE-like cation transporter